MRVCRKNRYSSPELSPEEIADIEESEKEFAEGKCKTFDTVEAFLKDLKE